jgi:hypothetical protein
MSKRIYKRTWRKKKRNYTAKSSKLKICRKQNKYWCTALRRWKLVSSLRSSKLNRWKSNCLTWKKCSRFRQWRLKTLRRKWKFVRKNITSCSRNFWMRSRKQEHTRKPSVISWAQFKRSSRKRTKSSTFKDWCICILLL